MVEQSVARSCTGFDVTLHDPGIAVVTFNEPDRMNLATAGFKRDLLEFMTSAQMSNEVRVIVFTGSGRAFTAGDDLRNYDDYAPTTVPAISGGHDSPIRTANGLKTFSQALTLAVRNLDKITIAAVNGLAIQLGLTLSLACDFRIAATTAKFGSPTLRFGFLPDDGGHYLLVQHLGVARTLEFLLNKQIITADEAFSWGLVTELREPDDVVPRALEVARGFADGPQIAMRMLKRAVYIAAETTMERALEDIAIRTAVAEHAEDAQEGKAAFIEKRAPVFNAWLQPDRDG